MSWFVEEFVESDQTVSKSVKAITFLSQAVDFYAATSRPRRLGASLHQYGVTFKTLQDLFAHAGSVLADSCESRTWPFGLIHGDLSPGNMIAGSDGRLVVIDWELFGRGAIAWDLRDLVNYCRRETVEEVLRSVGARDDLEPQLQLRIAAALELGIRLQNRDLNIRYFTTQGMSREHALEQVEARESALLRNVGEQPP